METLEDYLPQIQLLTLQNYNNTIIAYQAYVRFGKKAIADYCREKIRKEVRVTVKDDDYINEDGLTSQNHPRHAASRTVLLQIIG